MGNRLLEKNQPTTLDSLRMEYYVGDIHFFLV